MTFAAPTTGGSTTRGDVYLDYTGGGLYAASQLDEHMRLLRGTVFGNPHSVNPTSSAATALVERRARAVLRYFDAPEDEYACIFTPNATRRAAARRRGVSVRRRGPVPRDVRQPQLGQRHPRVRAGEGREDRVRAARGARPAGGGRRARALSRRHGAAGHNLFAYPAQSNFSGRQAPARMDRGGAGARLGRDRRRRRVRADEPARPLGLEAGLRPDLLLQDVRLPDRPRRAARAARRRSRGCSGRGSAAAPWSRRTSRATWSCRSRATRCSRTAPSTTSASRRSRSACATSSASASTRSRGASRRSGRGCSSRAAAAAALRRQPGDARLRAGDVGRPRGDDRVQLPPSGRPRRRRAVRRHRRGRARDLGSHRLLLQLGRGRDRVLALARHADRRRVRRRDDPRRLHPADRDADGRRGPRLARARRRTSPTSTASSSSPASSATWRRSPIDLPPRLAC